MGLQKGQTNNKNGKPKGTKHLKTQQWEKLGEFIIGEGAEKFIEEIKMLDDVDYINAFTKVLSYFKPQLARTILTDERKQIKPTVIIASNQKELKELNAFLDETD